MSHRASKRFWRLFAELPPEVQILARQNFALLKQNPRHPSLHLKRLGQFWSVRIGLHYRAVGINSPAGITWFWVGNHEEYDKLFGK